MSELNSTFYPPPTIPPTYSQSEVHLSLPHSVRGHRALTQAPPVLSSPGTFPARTPLISIPTSFTPSHQRTGLWSLTTLSICLWNNSVIHIKFDESRKWRHLKAPQRTSERQCRETRERGHLAGQAPRREMRERMRAQAVTCVQGNQEHCSNSLRSIQNTNAMES